MLQVLDVCTMVKPQCWELKEVALFLNTPNSLDPSMALGLYVKAGESEWLYRGCVHNGHPSEVMPLQVSGMRAHCLLSRTSICQFLLHGLAACTPWPQETYHCGNQMHSHITRVQQSHAYVYLHPHCADLHPHKSI